MPFGMSAQAGGMCMGPLDPCKTPTPAGADSHSLSQYRTNGNGESIHMFDESIFCWNARDEPEKQMDDVERRSGGSSGRSGLGNDHGTRRIQHGQHESHDRGRPVSHANEHDTTQWRLTQLPDGNRIDGSAVRGHAHGIRNDIVWLNADRASGSSRRHLTE